MKNFILTLFFSIIPLISFALDSNLGKSVSEAEVYRNGEIILEGEIDYVTGYILNGRIKGQSSDYNYSYETDDKGKIVSFTYNFKRNIFKSRTELDRFINSVSTQFGGKIEKKEKEAYYIYLIKSSGYKYLTISASWQSNGYGRFFSNGPIITFADYNHLF